MLRSPLLSLVVLLLPFALLVAACDSGGSSDDGGDDPPDDPPPSVAALRITEIHDDEQWVELHNTGDAAIDVSQLFLCVRPSYLSIAQLDLLNGERTIPAGGYIVVAWSQIRPDEGEVGLYRAATSDFGNADQILDYVQYGAAGQGRASTAGAAGIWTTGDFAPSSPSDQSIALLDDTNPDDASSWGAAPPTPGMENVASGS
jgi:hypothetical protein